MANNIVRFNEYRKTSYGYVETGHGYRANPSNLVLARFIGINGVDGESLMNVITTTGKTVATFNDVDNNNYSWFIFIDEYKKTSTGYVQVVNSEEIQLLVNPSQVSTAVYIGRSIDDRGIWTVTCNDGSKFVTNWGGISLLDNWDSPLIPILLP